MGLVPVLIIIVILIALAILGTGIFSFIVRNKPMNLVTISEAKYYIVFGDTEIEITADEAKTARKQGYTVIQK